MNRILLLGCNGQLGSCLAPLLRPLGELVAIDRQDCDLADDNALQQQLEQLRPEIIVNAAAYTAVDVAETDPGLAERLNADVPAVLGAYAASSNAQLIHYSTDYVFDGGKTAPYVETDATGPLSVYGRSKLAGEVAIQESGARALIFRTSWVFGPIGHNFVKTILRLARERSELKIVSDQVGQPTPAELIAAVTASILARRGREAGQGTYHLAAAEPVSWHAFATVIVSMAREYPAFAIRLLPDDVTAICTADYPTPARRPANSRLDCSKLRRDFQLNIPDWRPYLRRMLQLSAGPNNHRLEPDA